MRVVIRLGSVLLCPLLSTTTSGYHRTVERPIVFWPSERDEANLAILKAAGLSGDDALRAALTSLAAEYTPVVWALATADADGGSSQAARG